MPTRASGMKYWPQYAHRATNLLPVLRIWIHHGEGSRATAKERYHPEGEGQKKRDAHIRAPESKNPRPKEECSAADPLSWGVGVLVEGVSIWV